MDFYPLALLVHLFSAIIFVGYLFFDVVIFPVVGRIFGDETRQKVAAAIGKREGKIMPPCLVLLLLSGGFMLSRYVGAEAGFFATNLQKLLLLKTLLAAVIFVCVGVSLSCAFVFKCKNPLAKIIHPLALFLAFFIVLLAKIAFFV